MMMLYDTSGKPVTLETQVARGGEGVVFTVRGQADLVAKVYTPMPREGHEEKLRWMLGHPPADPSAPRHASIAWPRDLLFDAHNHFLGYVMPFVKDAVPVLRVFNPRSRATTLPGFDTRYLYRAAHNLARAMGALHREGYVVGDLNESNVLVSPSALVALIDTDSFQVKERRPGRIIVYPCPVGKPEYTAPELQGLAFGEVERTWEHDAFALAVLVYQLLMGGNHPFRARWLGTGDPPPLEDRIRRDYFPYANGRSPEGTALVAPPPGAPPLETLHPDLAALVQRCFTEGHSVPGRRPAAQEWERGLAAAEHALVDCPRGHTYAGHLSACPTCGAERSAARQGRPATRAARARRATGAGTAGPTRSGAGQRQAAPSSAPDLWPQIVKLFMDGVSFLAGPPAGSQAGSTSTRSSHQSSGTRQILNWTLQHLAGGATGSRRASGPAARAASAIRLCQRCGWPNNADEIYCQRCAYPLAGTRPCPSCGKPMPRNTLYCTHCSARV